MPAFKRYPVLTISANERMYCNTTKIKHVLYIKAAIIYAYF